MEAVVFFVSAAVILGGAIGVIISKNPVHAALSLVATLFGVAIQFINLGAYFIAVVQVIVYAGAIVVLFLFVIMLLGVDKAEDVETEPIIAQRQLAALAGAGLLALAIIIGISVGGDAIGTRPSDATPSAGGLAVTAEVVELDDGTQVLPQENIREIGRALFTTRFVFAFEITAILLTIAVVGAVVLARRPTGDLEAIPDTEPSWALRRPPETVAEADDGAPEDNGAAEDEAAEEEPV